MKRRFRSGIVVLFAAVSVVVSSSVFADQIDDEYLRREQALGADDVAGHYKLAEWCRGHKRWDLVARQCRTVIRLDQRHQRAKTLLEMARAHLKVEHRSQGGDNPKPGSAAGKRPRVLTDAEVQKIRRAELDQDGPERARVKIDRRVAKAFLEAMQSNVDFPYDRRTFNRMRPIEKAMVILEYGGDRHVEGVTVNTNPNRMRVFKDEVMSLVAAGCATAECHGGSGPGTFHLYGGRSLRDNVVYTNFLVLHEYERDHERLINRKSPERSLLLTYGLPPTGGNDSLNHPTPIDVVYQKGTQDRNYQTVFEWLQSLDLEYPDYGIDLKTAPKP
ncbi:MAG: hypothetical protein V3W34_03025 [Phycisphaerae bacterium]